MPNGGITLRDYKQTDFAREPKEKKNIALLKLGLYVQTKERRGAGV